MFMYVQGYIDINAAYLSIDCGSVVIKFGISEFVVWVDFQCFWI